MGHLTVSKFGDIHVHMPYIFDNTIEFFNRKYPAKMSTTKKNSFAVGWQGADGKKQQWFLFHN